MRRLLFAFLAAFCVLLFGCVPKNSRPLLWYQDVFTTATLTDGTTTWRLAPIPGGYTAEILSPASIAGITFTVTDTSAEVSMGDMHIPVSEAMTRECDRLIALFRLSEENLIGVEAPGDDPEGITYARFRRDGAEYTAGLRADGLPAFFDITIDGITVRFGVSEILCGDD